MSRLRAALRDLSLGGFCWAVMHFANTALPSGGQNQNVKLYDFALKISVGTHAYSPMPHFHFHVRDGADLLEDLEGAEFPNAEAAQADAAAAARGVLAERLKTGQPLDGLQFEICDEAGRLVATVPIQANPETA
jgi:hypothetical protein